MNSLQKQQQQNIKRLWPKQIIQCHTYFHSRGGIDVRIVLLYKLYTAWISVWKYGLNLSSPICHSFHLKYEVWQNKSRLYENNVQCPLPYRHLHTVLGFLRLSNQTFWNHPTLNQTSVYMIKNSTIVIIQNTVLWIIVKTTNHSMYKPF